MNRYKQALGKLDFTVDGLDFTIKPKQGDNLRFLELQEEYEDEHSQLMKEFVDFATNLLNRSDSYEKDSEDYKNLRMFVELNVTEFFKEFLIAFRHTTREKWEAQERKQIEGFQKELEKKS